MNRKQKRDLEKRTRRNMSKAARTLAPGAGPGGPNMISQKDVFAKIGVMTVELEQNREVIGQLIQQCQGYIERLKAADLLLPEEQEEIDMAEANAATAAEAAEVPPGVVEAAAQVPIEEVDEPPELGEVEEATEEERIQDEQNLAAEAEAAGYASVQEAEGAARDQARS